MNKIKYSILVLLMSISLIGIIFVQSFWIKTTLDNRERQFSLNVNQALKAVTESIKDREMRDYLAVYQKLIDTLLSITKMVCYKVAHTQLIKSFYLKYMINLGSGIDAVSIQEVKLALKAGEH